MKALPPGTILQLMYLKERLQTVESGRFLEIGPGSGEITRLLLKLGWEGRSYELEPRTVELLKKRFSHDIFLGRYDAINSDFFDIDYSQYGRVDLIISCMVIEHFSDDLESEFMLHCSYLLGHTGLMIGFVPSSPAHWGIEDEINGHYRRYTRKKLLDLAFKNGWKISHLIGLTYPISNILLPFSNFIVRRAEKSKLTLSYLEKTMASGIRNVRFKTNFPDFFYFLLNEYVLSPFYWLQKAFSSSNDCLVLYFEASPPQLKIKSDLECQ